MEVEVEVALAVASAVAVAVASVRRLLSKFAPRFASFNSGKSHLRPLKQIIPDN